MLPPRHLPASAITAGPVLQPVRRTLESGAAVIAIEVTGNCSGRPPSKPRDVQGGALLPGVPEIAAQANKSEQTEGASRVAGEARRRPEGPRDTPKSSRRFPSPPAVLAPSADPLAKQARSTQVTSPARTPRPAWAPVRSSLRARESGSTPLGSAGRDRRAAASGAAAAKPRRCSTPGPRQPHRAGAPDPRHAPPGASLPPTRAARGPPGWAGTDAPSTTGLPPPRRCGRSGCRSLLCVTATRCAG